MPAEIFVLTPCASSKSYEIRLKNKRINLEKAVVVLGESVVAKTSAMLIVLFENVAATIYLNNIMLKDADEKKAKECAKAIIEKLENGGALY